MERAIEQAKTSRLNEHFIGNMLGKRVTFDVQPYERGVGTISAITAREITVREFEARRGGTIVTYETFDLTIDVEDGSKIGALWGGVLVRGTISDLAGKKTTIIGVRRDQVHDAVIKGETIVIARCG